MNEMTLTIETQSTYGISNEELELTGKSLTRRINNVYNTTRKTKNYHAFLFWQSMKWMHGRKSMKGWSLLQLIERNNEVEAYYNITTEIYTNR